MFQSGLKSVFDRYSTKSYFYPKSLCDGHVIELPIFKFFVLIIKHLVCDGYVIEPKGIILFDGYLTEGKSFQQFADLTYLTVKPKLTPVKYSTPYAAKDCLFDGYLMIGQFLNQTLLIINHFLFDGYLTMEVNNAEFLCNGHVTGRGVLSKITLIINHLLCDGYVTGTAKSYLMAI